MAVDGQQWANVLWYGDSPVRWVLVPFSWLYRSIVALRRFCYDVGVLKARALAVPVIVVGNLTAGGAGKTPITIWLVNALRQRGIHAGIVSRGYGGKVGTVPQMVTADSDPATVGDEPLLMAKRCACPIAVHPNRTAAAERLIAEGVDAIVADDGLQHYRLARDYEILVIDGMRGFGNGQLLPAGPLREPKSRAETVDAILVNGTLQGRDRLPMSSHSFRLVGETAWRVDGSASRDLALFAGEDTLAVAGIANPGRFFDMLRAAGIHAEELPLGDHAPSARLNAVFERGKTVLMTEKDAVKCTRMAPSNAWYVPVDVDGLDLALLEGLENVIAERRHRDTH